MKVTTKIQIILLVAFTLLNTSCRKKEGCTDSTALNYDSRAVRDDGSCEYEVLNPTAYSLKVPYTFSKYLLPPLIPEDNPMTKEGVELGRKLFYEKILSGDNSMSCAGCHRQANAFADTGRFSMGIDGQLGGRSAMPIFNAAWNNDHLFFWDGRANSIEDQAFGPVVNPVEMHETWVNAVSELQAHSEYPRLFKKVFGTETIDSVLVAKAIAQFERTLISGNSKFDKYLRGEVSLTPQELSGFNVFMDEAGGDCFHCHGSPTNPLWTDNKFRNNGLDAVITDKGLGAITGDPNDDGKFKTPSLRNLSYTAPYMHDGRFATIDDVINFYSVGLQYSPTIDPLMKNVGVGGAQLDPQERLDLKAFLMTLNDEDFVNNPDFSDPN